MSTNCHTLPASAGAGFASNVEKGRLTQAFHRIAKRWREALHLRRTLREIEALSDRDLVDIGLDRDEIQRLRRGDTFLPATWKQC
jgi:uncharacterized protein YjiS (DUF1127 family)